jgi:hypothetical protein
VLKKAGIIIAVATAGLLAVSPVAFASESGDAARGHDYHSEPGNNEGDSNYSGGDRINIVNGGDRNNFDNHVFGVLAIGLPCGCIDDGDNGGGDNGGGGGEDGDN